MRYIPLAFLTPLLSAVVSFAQNPAPKVLFDSIPRTSQLYAANSNGSIKGVVVSEVVRSINFRVYKDQALLHDITRDVSGAEKEFDLFFTLDPGLFAYSFVAIIDTGGVPDTIARATDIVCGEVIAVEGQSNSIVGDPTLPPSTWAHTFGGNFSNSDADTLFAQSVASGNGGGPNVGAWGLYLQNKIATEMQMPTCVINGGVGGTRIEQHLPDPTYTYNLSTIYGSWIYRIRKSGLQSHIRWLFWYQGESNAGTDDYLTLFDQLYNNWKLDLPNLQHIVVIQIRPGCGLAAHATLREQQRALEAKYPDVVLHAAVGLPAHDGCHYAPSGYQTLGEQLFKIYRTTELSMMPGKFATSPMIESAICANTECTVVRLTFRRASRMRITNDTLVGGETRRYTDAFFANGNEALHPLNATFSDSDVVLVFGVSAQSVSYIPDTFYPGTQVVYEGPWLVNEDGTGALTFHDVPTTPITSVGEIEKQGNSEIKRSKSREVKTRCITIQQGDPLPDYLTNTLTLTGEHVNTLTLTGEHVTTLTCGVYVVRLEKETILLLVRP